MRFYALTSTAPPEADLRAEYRSARAIGAIRLGESRLFFRAGRNCRYLPYTDISRYYRRVMMIPARLCCGSGSLNVDYLVLEHNGTELVQVQLPGARAAQGILAALHILAPDAAAGKPKE